MRERTGDARDAALLTPREMAAADQATIRAGVPGPALMERAGAAVARAASAMTRPGQRIVVLCGPGNNGGDGFVAARQLRNHQRSVDVLLLAEPERLKGDARWAFNALSGGWRLLSRDVLAECLDGAHLVIDALFGAGLDRPLAGVAAEAVRAVAGSGVPVLSADLPSGVNGATGEVLQAEEGQGLAFRAAATVTFFRRKPGHVLYPGRGLCGKVEVAQIGIEPSVLNEIAPRQWVNGPDVWGAAFPRVRDNGHKYDRGHALVLSGGAASSGAARLSALGALRIGAGLVTLGAPPSAMLVNAAHLTAVMLRSVGDADALTDLLEDRRFTSVLAGPGFGLGQRLDAVLAVLLSADRALVLDADALTALAVDPEGACARLRERAAPVVLTPHEGEFGRLFPDLKGQPKPERARAAAHRCGAIIVLKGADTVIAHPDGQLVINDSGAPWLATAGSGDVLAGLVCGLLAQGMLAFEAACAAVWIHGQAGSRFGPGLIAEDLPGQMPGLLSDLLLR